MEKYKKRTRILGSYLKHTEPPFVCGWSAFQAGHVLCALKTICGKKWGLKLFTLPQVQKVLSYLQHTVQDSYERRLLQEKMWRPTLGKKQGTGRKPSKNTEGREVLFLNLGAAIRRAHNTDKSATTDVAKGCILHLSHPTSPLKPTQIPTRPLRSATSCFLTDSSFSKHTSFPYGCAAADCTAIPH